MMSAAEPYISAPLPFKPRSIRLLHFYEPFDAVAGSPLVADLEVFPLDQCPEFSALSYVWATGVDQPCTIICNGAVLLISQNCFSALTHIRQKLGDQRIWVDAICINQEDDNEKAQQIPLMGSIYSGADCVYIWLGEGDLATDRAIAYLKAKNPIWAEQIGRNFGSLRIGGALYIFLSVIWISLCKNLFRLVQCERRNKREDGRASLVSRYKANVPRGLCSATAADLENLLSCIWMRRVWTYQELMLANNPIIICGTAAIPWNQFATKIAISECLPAVANDTALSRALSTWRNAAVARSRLRARLHYTRPSSRHFQTYAQEQWSIRNPQIFVYYLPSLLWIPKAWLLLTCSLLIVYFPGIFSFAMKEITRRRHASDLWHSFGGTVSTQSCSAYSIFGAPTVAVLWRFNSTFSGTTCVSEVALAKWQPVRSASPGIVTAACTAACELGSLECQRSCINPPLVLLWTIPGVLCVNMAITALMYLLVHCADLPRTRKARPILYDAQNARDDLVDVVFYRKAADPRDKAFALYSILEHMLETPIASPDYNLPLFVVYRNLTLDLLRAIGSPYTILAASVFRIRDGASWVADWSSEFPDYWLKPSITSQQNANATPGSTPFFDYASESGLLSLRGRQICSIGSCALLQPTQAFYRDEEKSAHLKNIEIMCQLFEPNKSPRNRSARIELQSYVLDTDNHTDLPLHISSNSILAYRDLLCMHSHESSSEILALMRSQESMACYYKDDQDSQWKISAILGSWRPRHMPYQTILQTHIAICNSLAKSKRKFFRTKDMIPRCFNFRHIADPRTCWLPRSYQPDTRTRETLPSTRSALWGVCTDDVQPGDKILLIAGLFMPIVARPHGDTYRIVSPAIINGVMRGQAWYCRMNPSREENLENFKFS